MTGRPPRPRPRFTRPNNEDAVSGSTVVPIGNGLFWHDEPPTTRAGHRQVRVTTDEANALRRAAGLPPVHPDPDPEED